MSNESADDGHKNWIASRSMSNRKSYNRYMRHQIGQSPEDYVGAAYQTPLVIDQVDCNRLRPAAPSGADPYCWRAATDVACVGLRFGEADLQAYQDCADMTYPCQSGTKHSSYYPPACPQFSGDQAGSSKAPRISADAGSKAQISSRTPNAAYSVPTTPIPSVYATVSKPPSYAQVSKAPGRTAIKRVFRTR